MSNIAFWKCLIWFFRWNGYILLWADGLEIWLDLHKFLPIYDYIFCECWWNGAKYAIRLMNISSSFFSFGNKKSIEVRQSQFTTKTNYVVTNISLICSWFFFSRVTAFFRREKIDGQRTKLKIGVCLNWLHLHHINKASTNKNVSSRRTHSTRFDCSTLGHEWITTRTHILFGPIQFRRTLTPIVVHYSNLIFLTIENLCQKLGIYTEFLCFALYSTATMR